MVVDADGNVVSMTTTIESVFGSGRAVAGFVLNNQLTDFSFAPTDEGQPVANAVHGGKRPRSSMAPVIVLDHDGNFVAALGSPGGGAITEYNAKALVGLLAWKLTIKQAIELPNLIARGDNFTGELAKFTPEVLAGLRERGMLLKLGRAENSGLQGVVRLLSIIGSMVSQAVKLRQNAQEARRQLIVSTADAYFSVIRQRHQAENAPHRRMPSVGPSRTTRGITSVRPAPPAPRPCRAARSGERGCPCRE